MKMKLFILLFFILVSNIFAANNKKDSEKFNNELTNTYYYTKNLIFSKEMMNKEYFLITLLSSIQEELEIRKKENKTVVFPREDELKKITKDLSTIKYNIDKYTVSSVTDKLQNDVLEEYNLTLLRARLLKTALIESATPEEKKRMFNADYKLGLKAYAEKDFEFTYFIFNEILSIYNYKNLDDVMFYNAECQIKRNSLTEAARTYQRIIEEYPESSFFKKSFARLISVYYLKGDYDKIVLSHKIAEKSMPMDSLLTQDLSFILGLAYYKQLEYKNAAYFLGLIKENDSYSNEALYLRANCFSLMHQHDLAKDLYLKIKDESAITDLKNETNMIYENTQLKLGYLSFNMAESRKKVVNASSITKDEIYNKTINDAFEYFSKIGKSSRYYQDALMGKAWVEHNLGRYENSNTYLVELTTKFPDTEFIYEAKTLQGFNKDMLGQTDSKNEDYEFVLKAQVELDNNELFISERLLISSLVTKLSSAKRQLFEQGAPMTKFEQYYKTKDSLMYLLKQTNQYQEKISQESQVVGRMTDNSYRTKLLSAIINATKSEINRLNDMSAALLDIQSKLQEKSNYKELVSLTIEKNKIQNLLQQADMINIFSDKKLNDVKSRDVDIQRWSDLSFLKYVLNNIGIDELDKIEHDLDQVKTQINKIDNQLNSLPNQ